MNCSVVQLMAEGFGFMLLHKYPSREAFASTLRYAGMRSLWVARCSVEPCGFCSAVCDAVFCRHYAWLRLGAAGGRLRHAGPANLWCALLIQGGYDAFWQVILDSLFIGAPCLLYAGLLANCCRCGGT
jgi:hypothetical protein